MILGPRLENFRTEISVQNILYLTFDMPGRSMNVFSNSAIDDLARFSEWVKTSSVKGVVVQSGKASAFCAGADLAELGQAYDMIMQAAPERRYDLAFDHFFKLSAAIRALETCGKPVATAISGLALGGGCEFAMGTHYRVLADTPKAAMGLPESLVGLLPGAGGTQRLPRLIGVARALPILLEGARLSGRQALDAGLVHELVGPGEEFAAAERWVLEHDASTPLWDQVGWLPADLDQLTETIHAERRKVMRHTLGHYPAPLAILNCIEQGYPQPIDQAIRTEMALFSHLIQRPEPRDMIRTMFVAKTDYDRRLRNGGLPETVSKVLVQLPPIWQMQNEQAADSLLAAGFVLEGRTPPALVEHNGAPYWFDQPPLDETKRMARIVLDQVVAEAAKYAAELGPEEQRLADYALVATSGFPAYLGGPFSLLSQMKKI
jgi:3-hydroxyacyl-CoA dehydrogenase/enoyl-CoA hydratase/3-hydroxybutyryl-CoA epimerase